MPAMIGKTRHPDGGWIVTRDKKPTGLTIVRDPVMGGWDLCTEEDFILSGSSVSGIMRRITMILANVEKSQ